MINSAQFDTAQSLTPRSMILSEDSEKYEYLGEKKTKNGNILNHWSVAQAGSNDKKTGCQKSRWTAPLNIIFCLNWHTQKKFYHPSSSTTRQRDNVIWPQGQKKSKNS